MKTDILLFFYILNMFFY